MHIWSIVGSRAVYIKLSQSTVCVLMLMKENGHPLKHCGSLVYFNKFWATMVLCGTEEYSISF